MMRVRKLIDWMEYTKSGFLCPTQDFCPEGEGWKIEEILKPTAFYDHVGRCVNGSIVMRGKTESQGMRLIASGQPMRSIRELGFSDMDMVKESLRDGRKPARIDFAIDVLGDEKADIQECRDAIERGEALTRVRTAPDYDDALRDGRTLYIGSPKSDRNMRIYDKRSEQGNMLMEAWIRVEIENGGRYARAFAQDAIRSGLSVAGSETCRKFCDFPKVGWYQDCLGDRVDIELSNVPRKETNWESWVKGQVYKSLRSKLGTSEQRVVEDLIQKLSEDMGMLHLVQPALVPRDSGE